MRGVVAADPLAGAPLSRRQRAGRDVADRPPRTSQRQLPVWVRLAEQQAAVRVT